MRESDQHPASVVGAAPLLTPGARPIVITPANAAEISTHLRSAHANGIRVIPTGHARVDRDPLGGGPEPVSPDSKRGDILMSLERLTSPIDHCAGDLTATVPAGTRLRDLNAALQQGGQWLPIDPPASDALTIGGLVATNASGPRRHRYGTPRDLIIGVEMVLADGRIAKAGGRVVKNVAGYDLARVLCGSFGSLAVITSATFKLFPRPAASRTVAITVADPATLSTIARLIDAAPLTPSAIDFETPPHRLLVRFETTVSAADREASMVCDLCAGAGARGTILPENAEVDAWSGYESRVWSGDGTLLKLAVLPTNVARMLEDVDRVAHAHSIDYRAAGQAAIGVLYVRLLPTHIDHHASVVTAVRAYAVEHGGSVVVVSADSRVIGEVDRWGDMGDAWPLMRAVKMRFDPNGILNPGGGPGGL
jgi:glycolate oxidase FAD binding subunit